MTDNYVQTVEVEAPSKLKAMHTAGTVLELIALGLVLVAIFFSYYFFIAVAAIFALGLTLNQLYNNCDREYEYAFNRERLIISKKNQLGRSERKLELLTADITSYETFSDMIEREDLIFCADKQSPDVKTVRFTVDGASARMLFEPDGYLDALISETLSELKKKQMVPDGVNNSVERDNCEAVEAKEEK